MAGVQVRDERAMATADANRPQPEEMASVQNSASTSDVVVFVQGNNQELSMAEAPEKSTQPQERKELARPQQTGNKLSRWILWLQILSTFIAALILLPSGSGSPGRAEWFSNATTSWTEGVTVCPRSVICSVGLDQVTLLAGARLTAYFMYPALGAVFLSKCHALNTKLATTYLAVFVPLIDLHVLHTQLGNTVVLMVVLHTVFHMVRWALRSELDMLFSTSVGLSGLSAALCTIPMTLLMVGRFGSRHLIACFVWETRKAAHFLCIPFGISMFWHAARLRIFIGIILSTYIADKLYTFTKITYRVDCQLCRLANGVQVSFKHPPGYNPTAVGYINILVPWISATQWHPFSVYGHRVMADESSVCVCVAGDWTKALHDSLTRPISNRSIWVQGPFASPTEGSATFDNLLLVASGNGIISALSCMNHHHGRPFGKTHTHSLLWMCRDPSLIEFFIDVVEFDEDGFTLIYYTGKTQLRIPHGLPSNIRILTGRPNIQTVSAQIIQSIEEAQQLPHDILEQSVQPVTSATSVRGRALQSLDTLVDKEAVVQALELVCKHNCGGIHAMFLSWDIERNGFLDEGSVKMGLQRNNSGTCTSISDEIVNILIAVVLDGANRVAEDAFASGISALQQKLDMIVTTNTTPTTPPKDDPVDYVKTMPIERTQQWGILYCGGATIVSRMLEKISKEFNLSYASESFQW